MGRARVRTSDGRSAEEPAQRSARQRFLPQVPQAIHAGKALDQV